MAAEEILNNLGKTSDSELTLQDIRNINEILKNGLSNGDGIIPSKNIEDPELKTFVENIIKCYGSVEDVNGVQGVNSELLATFLKNARDYIDWKDSKDYNPETLPLHEKTADAYAIFNEIRPKIDEYFKLCSLKRYNKILDRHSKDELCKSEVSSTQEEAEEALRSAPVAPLNVNKELKLDGEINPAYESVVASLITNVLDEFLARPVISLIESDWLKVCDIFKPYEDWIAAQKGTEVKVLDDSQLRSYLNGELAANWKN